MIAEKKVKERPRRPATDWPAIRMLFATGKTFEAISEATGIPKGTLTARSSRENWDADRKAVQAVAAEASAKSQAILASMPERAKNWVHRVAEQTDKHLSVIEQAPVETLKDVDKIIGTLDKVDRVARRSYGLDEEGSGNKTIVNLGFLQDYKPEVLQAEIIESALP